MSARKSLYPMIEMKDALDIVRKAALQHSSGTVTLDLAEASGYVCAENVFSPENFPRFRTSVMDGYAVRAPLTPGEYTVRQHLFAGDAVTAGTEVPGEVAYITTGSRVPDWATGVVKVEDTAPVEVEVGAAAESDEKVHISVSCVPDMFVRQVGSDIKAGALLLARGATITPVELALLATVGVPRVCVWAPPRVGVMSTGNELTEHSDSTSFATGDGSSMIRDSNRVALLAALVSENRLPIANVVDLGIVRDSRAELTGAFKRAIADCDVVLTTGGVSMGAADLVKPLLAEMGTVHFGRLNMKPGKPCTFATAVRPSGRGCFLFGLPGNPVSALVCKTLLVDPLLQSLLRGGGTGAETATGTGGGASGGVEAASGEYASEATVELADLALRMDPERPEYHRCCVFLQRDGGRPEAEARLVAYSTGAQQSSRVMSLQAANALLKVPAGSGELRRGNKCPAILLALPKSVVVDEAAAAAAAGPDQPVVHPSGCACCRNSVMQEYYAKTIPPKVAPVAGTVPLPSAPKSHTGNAPKITKMAVRVGVITVSDRAFEGVYADTSGPEVARLLLAMGAGGTGGSAGFYPLEFSIDHSTVVPDNKERIQETLRSWCGGDGGDGAVVDFVVTTGGTGFGLKDYTPEAVRPMFTREAPGIAQALLAEGLKHTPLVVGVRNQTLVCTLPGSVKAIRENIVVLKDLLPRIMELLIRNECT